MQQYRRNIETYRKRAIQDIVTYLYATVDRTWLLHVESGKNLRDRIKILHGTLETDSKTKM